MSPPPVVDGAVLDDLRDRLRRWRPVAGTGVAGWGRGTDPDVLASLVRHWAADYDWRAHEQVIRSWPWRLAGALRLVQLGDAGVPVVLLHGWPDSVLRYSRAWPLLGDLQVVVPALPGYPFALPLASSDVSAADMADLVAESMTALGHDRFVVSGGDIGRGVAVSLAVRHAHRVAALHLTDVAGVPLPEPVLEAGRRWRLREGAYLLEQVTRPHTLMVGLGDSPAGLAAWIVEKLRAWSDCGGDVESVWARDELLTWVTAYWVDACIGTSFGPYTKASPPAPGRLEIPTVVTQFPGELVPVPRSAAEAAFDLREWHEPPAGGHFGAWERPDDYVAGVRAAAALA